MATRKARLLLRAGANLTVVSPQIDKALEQLLADHGGIWQQARYQEVDLHGRQLVIAATADKATNEQVYQQATARALPVTWLIHPSCVLLFFLPLLIAIR